MREADVVKWWEHAACAGVDVNEFFPENTTVAKRYPLVRQAAGRYCRDCPVRRECFEDAIVAGDAYGIRGGYDLQHTRVQAFVRSARTLQRVRAIEEPDVA